MGFVHSRQINGNFMRQIRQCKLRPTHIEFDGKWLLCLSRKHIEVCNLKDPSYELVIEMPRDGRYTRFLPDFESEQIIYNFGRSICVCDLKTKEIIPFQDGMLHKNPGK